MDKSYADTVRLLLQVTPDVFRNPNSKKDNCA